MIRSRAVILLAILFIWTPAIASESKGVSIEERAGEALPAGLPLIDESGGRVTLGSLLDRPVILFFSYYGCADVCPAVFEAVARLITRMDGQGGYRVVTVSIDERDGPESAAAKRNAFATPVRKYLPEGGWVFLTGGKEEIAALTGASGFSFERDGGGFRHPSSLIVLAPGGVISRYIYGAEFLPVEVASALLEASEGRDGPSIPRAQLFCFRDPPAARAGVGAVLKAGGAAVTLSAGAFLVYLSHRRRRRG